MPLTTVQSGMMDSTAQYYSFKNRLINGNFDIWQRGTTGTGAIYVADRWGTDQINTTQARSTDVPSGIGATYSLQVSGSSGTVATSQKIESNNAKDLASQQVTVSFYAKAASGTPTLNFDVRYANAVDNFSGMTIMQGSTVTLSTTWAKYTFTFNALNNNVANGLALFFYNVSTQTFLLSQVQLEKGTQATSFDYRPYTTETQLCYRYYFRAVQYSTYSPVGVGRAWSSTNGNSPFYLPVVMRSNQTITYSSLSHFDIVTVGNPTAIQNDGAGGNNVKVGWARTTGITNGNLYQFEFGNTTSGWLGFDAEL